MEIRQNHSLLEHNTFGIRAQADWFVSFHGLEDLRLLARDEYFQECRCLTIGEGSNLLFLANFHGVILHSEIQTIERMSEDEEHVDFLVGSGVRWNDFVSLASKEGLGGIENLALIPGEVGAAAIQNIGAYGVEIKDSFESCKVLNLSTLEIEVFDKKKCQFGYRDSFFKREGKGKYVILEVTFRLTRKEHVLKVEYGAIQSELEKMEIKNPTIQDVSWAVIRIRQSKLPDPKKVGNAGSFFKNPVVSDEYFDKLKTQFANIQGYKTEEGVKIPAGWLIEQCGWKGKQIGNVATHALQSLVIVNVTGDAKGQEIFDFSQKIIDSVEEKFGVKLEREVNVL